MITGDIKAKVDRIWDAFWAGGIANPMEVIEQITYLLFLRRLDDLHTLEENKAARIKKPIENPVFPPGEDSRGRPYQDLRWSRFKNFAPSDMYAVLSEHAFPFLRTLGGDDSTYAHHMKDARFTIPTPALLAKVVDLRLGPALETLPRLAAEGRGPFDLIFIDADKPGYPDYFRWALKLSRRGSVIIADNVVRDGAVIDAASDDPRVQGMRRFNEVLAAESRVSATEIQTVGSKGYDGFAIAVVIAEQ